MYSSINGNSNAKINQKKNKSTINTKMMNKILEVKEVIQNRPDRDIQKVLDYYEYDVNKTIQAFMNGNEAKNILLNCNNSLNTSGTLSPLSLSSNGNKSLTSSQTSTTLSNDLLNNKLDKLNKKSNSSNNNNNNKIKFNINDLVDSVINKYTSTSSDPNCLLLENNTKSIESDTLLNTPRPFSLDINDQLNGTLNGSTTKAKQILEKSQKDLQRQIITLHKLKTNFDEEIENSNKMCDEIFDNLHALLNMRQLNLKNKLNLIKLNGNDLLLQRQKRANELKIQVDNSEHMNDTQTQELKNEIKQFVSERKLDEDLGLTKRLTFDTDKLKEHIDNFGELIEVKNNYSLQKSPSSDNYTPITTPEPSFIATSINLFNSQNTNNDTTQSTTLVNTHEMQSSTNSNNNFEFKEVIKKPQRNKNNSRNTSAQQQQQQSQKPKTQQQQQNGKLLTINSTNGLINTENKKMKEVI